MQKTEKPNFQQKPYTKFAYAFLPKHSQPLKQPPNEHEKGRQRA